MKMSKNELTRFIYDGLFSYDVPTYTGTVVCHAPEDEVVSVERTSSTPESL